MKCHLMNLIVSMLTWPVAWVLFVGLAEAQELDSITSRERIEAVERIREATLRAHLRFLADDLLEGRAPGSRGDKLAQQYISSQFERLELVPDAPSGGWLQPVPLVGVRTHAPATMVFRHQQQQLVLKRHDEFVVANGQTSTASGFENAEVVFVGYGIVAPEYEWDDFKGMDLSNKVLLVMNNDPAGDPDLFEGNRRLYYGRWDYKYSKAAELGAAAAIIIHTTESAGYPYQVVQTSWSGEEFELRGQDGPRLKMRGWITDEAAKRLVALSGHDLDALRNAAESKEFRPIPLGTELSVSLTADVRDVDTANVVGLLPGSDEQLKNEAVVFMAHHDHIGVAAERDVSGDLIYNGAIDNASGVASLLAIAEACASAPQRPRRSLMFVTVGAEEQGLLGSEYFALHPPRPAGNLAAVINMDGINFLGPTREVNYIGYGKSSLDSIVDRVARYQARFVTPDQYPDRGYYYRSDQFSLAKVGVPGVYLHAGSDVIGKPAGWGKQQLDEWVDTRYHQPTDEYSPDWDLSGAILDLRLLLLTGLEVANRDELPSWTAGDEFEAARQEALRARKEISTGTR